MVKISESELDRLEFKSWMCHILVAGHLVSREEYTQHQSEHTKTHGHVHFTDGDTEAQRSHTGFKWQSPG